MTRRFWIVFSLLVLSTPLQKSELATVTPHHVRKFRAIEETSKSIARTESSSDKQTGRFENRTDYSATIRAFSYQWSASMEAAPASSQRWTVLFTAHHPLRGRDPPLA